MGFERGCARSCGNQDNVRFHPKTTYNYEVQAETAAGERQVKVWAVAKLAFPQPCDGRIELSEVRSDDAELVADLQQQATAFGYDDGEVSMCAADESAASHNLKAAILSALQVASDNLHATAIVKESDIFGLCDAKYELHSKKWSTLTIKKTKQMSSCQGRTKAANGLFPRSYQNDGPQSPSLFSNDYQCMQTIDKDEIRQVECVETNKLPFGGQKVVAKLTLRLKNKQNGANIDVDQISAPQPLSFRKPQLSADPLEATHALRALCRQLTEDAVQTPATFHQLVKAIRPLTFSQVQELASSIDDICEQRALKDIFVDAVLQSGGEGRFLLRISRNYKTAIIIR